MIDMIAEKDHLQRLTKIGIALSAEKDIDKFFKMVLGEAISFTNADAGSLYRISRDKKFLDFQLVCTLSKNILLGRVDIAKWPSVPLYNDLGKNNLNNFVSYIVHKQEIINIEDVYNQKIFDNSGTRKYDKANNYQSKSMLGVPLLSHEREVLGVIQLINALDDTGKIVSFTEKHTAMLTSLASQAAIALSNKELVTSLEDLLNQFIRTIAHAIDKKSKYTGDHISRVALLTEMIANSVNRDNHIFKFRVFNSDELQEISIAAWMHDFGKITTPEFIMDKSTKLESVYDRINLIETRFALIKTFLEKDIYRFPDRKDELSREIEILNRDLVFLKDLNKGRIKFSDSTLEILNRIADQSYHISGKEVYLITEDEYQHLKIREGTLSAEERHKMNEHVLVTEEMLSRITFPRKFRNIPRFASLHHEKLNGNGYPHQYTEKDMPLQARIIAIADIFESLTATDRPYKDGISLNTTLRIMAEKARLMEIDKDILDLILDTEIYRTYGKRYLQPHQIDQVNVEEIKKIYRD